MRLTHALIVGFAVLVLNSCSSEPTKRYFPPQASLQQLQQLSNGQWQAQVRLQNFSTGAVEYRNLNLKIQIQDLDLVGITATETTKIGAGNAEVFTLMVPFSTASQQVLVERLGKTQSVRYTLSGSVDSIDPNRTYTLDYQGRLNPAPGLQGVFR